MSPRTGFQKENGMIQRLASSFSIWKMEWHLCSMRPGGRTEGWGDIGNTSTQALRWLWKQWDRVGVEIEFTGPCCPLECVHMKRHKCSISALMMLQTCAAMATEGTPTPTEVVGTCTSSNSQRKVFPITPTKFYLMLASQSFKTFYHLTYFPQFIFHNPLSTQ